MHHFISIRRAALGAVLAGAAIAAVPNAASAASSCTFDPATKTMTVTNNAGGQPMTLRNSNTLTFRDGSGVNRSCFSPTTGVAASSLNTTKIKVRAAVPAAFQDTVIDESNNGRFVTSTGARMSVTVLTGTGLDHLGVLMGTGPDQVRVQTATSGFALGPQIDLNTDGVVDVGMTAAGLVTVDGGGGSDLLNGTGSNTFQLELKGGVSGNDTLRGGGKTDFLDGGIGADTIISKGDSKQDFVVGGPDQDRAVTETIDSVSGVEDREF
jgi:Ca2+-binding RTX toxin-like protein